MSKITNKAGFSDNEALNHIAGLGKAVRIADNTVLNADIFAVTAINGEVALDAGTVSDVFASGDVIPEGVTYMGRFTAVQRTVGSAGVLIAYVAGSTNLHRLEE